MAQNSDSPEVESPRGGSFLDSIKDAAESLGVDESTTFGLGDESTAAPEAPADDAEAKPEKIKVRSYERVKRKASDTTDNQKAESETAETAEADEVQQEAAAPEADEVQEQSELPAPEFWDAEEKAAYAKAPPEVRAIILRKEEQLKGFATRIQQERDGYKSFAEPYHAVTEEYKAHFIKRGESPDAAFRNAIEWDKELADHPVRGAAKLLMHMGISPEQVHRYLESGDLDAAPAMQSGQIEDPRVSELQARLDAIEQSKIADVQAQQKGLVTQFASEVGADGRPLRPHFMQFRPLIAEEARIIEQTLPHLSPQDVLKRAYDAAMGKVQGVVKPEADSLARATAAVKAQNSVMASRSGSSSGKSVPALSGSTREKIEQLANSIGFAQ